jgi:hypothetical protein
MHPSTIKADGTYPVVDDITYLCMDEDGPDEDGAQVRTNSLGTIAVEDQEKAETLLKRIQEVKVELKKKKNNNNNKKKKKDWHPEAHDPPKKTETLYEVNIGAAGYPTIQLLPGNSTAVQVTGFSHRWNEGTKENINRTTLLLQDAIDWAIRNILPHISDILYPNSSMSKLEKKKKFAEDCLVCTLLNRIINCLPGAIIDPWCMFETSTMPPAAEKIIYEI